MNTREVAEALKTDPKRLRRFLRSDVTYRNAGQGGRYEFTEKDLPTLRKRFDAWQNGKPSSPAKGDPDRPARRRRRGKDEVPAMGVEIATKKLSTTEREKRDKLSRERVDRLEERLRAAGLHISQSRHRQDA